MTDFTSKTKLEDLLKFNYWVYIAILFLPIDIGIKLFPVETKDIWSMKNISFIPSFLIILFLISILETLLSWLFSIPGAIIFNESEDAQGNSSAEYTIVELKRFAIKNNSSIIWKVIEDHEAKYDTIVANSKLYFKCFSLFVLNVWLGSSISILPIDTDAKWTSKIVITIILIAMMLYYAKEIFKSKDRYIKVNDYLEDTIERTAIRRIGIHKLEKYSNIDK